MVLLVEAFKGQLLTRRIFYWCKEKTERIDGVRKNNIMGRKLQKSVFLKECTSVINMDERALFLLKWKMSLVTFRA